MTPLSDAAIEKFPEFAAKVRGRLDNGRRDYGDSSFERPLLQLIEELKQELEDQAGWAFIAWARMAALERLVMEVTSAHRPTEDAPRVPICMGWPGEAYAEIGSAPAKWGP